MYGRFDKRFDMQKSFIYFLSDGLITKLKSGMTIALAALLLPLALKVFQVCGENYGYMISNSFPVCNKWLVNNNSKIKPCYFAILSPLKMSFTSLPT